MPREVAVVPAALAPVWRDLPVLAWVAARAYAPKKAPTWLAACLAAIAAPLWLVSFIGMRRRIAASNRHAVVTISRLKDPRGLALLGLGLLGALLAALAVLIVQRSPWAIVVGGSVLALTAMAPWRLIRYQAAMSRFYVCLRDREPDVPVYEVGALAAWPPGQGQGWRLLHTLLADIQLPGYVVGFPSRREAPRSLPADGHGGTRAGRGTVPGPADTSASLVVAVVVPVGHPGFGVMHAAAAMAGVRGVVDARQAAQGVVAAGPCTVLSHRRGAQLGGRADASSSRAAASSRAGWRIGGAVMAGSYRLGTRMRRSTCVGGGRGRCR
jgi:hypothetical protein